MPLVLLAALVLACVVCDFWAYEEACRAELRHVKVAKDVSQEDQGQ